MKAIKTIILLLIFLLPVSGILTHLDFFPGTLHSPYSDFSITHFPNAVFLKETLAQHSQFPLWSNTILSGYPFAANPLAGVWYPLGWLAYGFSLPAGLNLVTALHMVWGAVGMYLLLRQLKLATFPAIAGALLFETLPRLWAHSAAGHLTLVYAISWTPWLLWSEASSGARRRWLGGVVLGLILLADVRWVVYAGLIWAAFRFSRNRFPLRLGWRDRFMWIIETLRAPVIGVCLAAPLLIPMMEYLSLSTRVNLADADTLTFSLQLPQLLGVVFPDLTGYVEWVLYPGAVGVLAFIWSWLDRDLRRRTRLPRWGILGAIVLSLGSHFAPAGWLLSLPGLDFLRVPPRFMLVAGFLFCVLVAIWLDYLVSGLKPAPRQFFTLRLGLVGVCLAMMFLTAVFWLVNGEPPFTLIWGSGAMVILTVLSFVVMSRLSLSRVSALAILAILLLDTLTFDSNRMVFQKPEDVLLEGRAAVEFLISQPGHFRVYSPSYSIPQPVAAINGLELADGIDPLQLRAYVDYLQRAAGFEDGGYSVTVPPYKTANPALDNQHAQPDAALLGLLNIRFVASAYPIEGRGLVLVERVGSTRIYSNPAVFPRAWVQAGKTRVPVEEVTDALVREYSPNRIVVEAVGPGTLVLSEVMYPGWSVEVDGQSARLEEIWGLFRAVELPSGKHNVAFEFRPDGVFVGLGVAGVTLIAFLINLFKRRRDDLAE